MPVFRHNPDGMFSSNIVKAVQNNIFVREIPELLYPIGYTAVDDINPPHYLNPTENDTNLEYDPRKNLLYPKAGNTPP